MANDGGSEILTLNLKKNKKWLRVVVSSGKKGEFFAAIFDLTTRVLVEEQLSSVFYMIKEMLFEVDEEFTIVGVSNRDRVHEYFPMEEIVGQNLATIFSPELFREYKRVMFAARESNRYEIIRHALELDSGKKWLESRVWYFQGRVKEGYLLSCEDITEQVETMEKLRDREQVLQSVMDHIPIGIFWKDRDSRFLGCNRAFAGIVDFDSTDEVIGIYGSGAAPAEYAAKFLAEDKEVLETGQPLLGMKIVTTDQQGRTLIATESKFPLFDAEGHIYGVLGTTENVTEKYLAEQELLLMNERMEELAEKSRTAIFELDCEGRFTYMSPAAESVYGYKPEETVGLMSYFDLSTPEAREDAIKDGTAVMKNEESVDDLERELQKKNGETIWVLTNGVPLYDEQGVHIGFRGLDIDITRIKQSEAEARYLSFHDRMTGLYNRHFFEEELKRLDTERNLPFSLIMADINGLKLTNDAFGHEAGDELLIKAAQVLKSQCRAEDIIARVGGDEFIILLPRTDADRAATIAARVEKAAEKEKVRVLNVSLACGHATKVEKETKIEDIMKIAEAEMYRKKTAEKTALRNRAINNIQKELFRKIAWEKDHSHFCGLLSMELGRALGLSKDKQQQLKAAGSLHDIGKIAVAEEVLLKQGKLSREDWYEVKRHSEVGYIILSSSPEFIGFAEHVLHHHERWDGTGYPKGLAGKNIPLFARIMAIADAYDAMTGARNYQKAMSSSEALEILRKECGKQFDPELVEVFINEEVYMKKKVAS